jgi:hypothetical protein
MGHPPSAAGTVARAKEKVRLAVKAEAEAINERNVAEDRLVSARAELANIAAQEFTIKSQLDGQPYTDPTLGLDVPA